MPDKFKKIMLISVFFLLVMAPGSSLAWWRHDYTYYDWDWYGSGRDHPYSWYIDNKYNSDYVGYSIYDFDASAYVNYINHPGPPSLVPLPATMTEVPILPPPVSDEFTVNIPNRYGGYTPVLIKRSGSGFIGPQGEFYSKFPTVSQLEIMYGK